MHTRPLKSIDATAYLDRAKLANPSDNNNVITTEAQTRGNGYVIASRVAAAQGKSWLCVTGMQLMSLRFPLPLSAKTRISFYDAILIL